MNRGVRPGSVGRKKGAAAGAAGGATGLFLLWKHTANQWFHDLLIIIDYYSSDESRKWLLYY